jgi:predicted nucleic acid-binding protein
LSSLIDEKLGREVANRLGLRTIGILGVLLESYRRGLIPEVKAVLDQLETEAGFWVSSQLRLRVLRLAGE